MIKALYYFISGILIGTCMILPGVSGTVVAIMIGIFAGALGFIRIGIVMECVILGFQLITLPVEFNASSRALKQLKELKIVEDSEHSYCFKMLRAAALTYVASVATAVLQVLRLVLMSRRND